MRSGKSVVICFAAKAGMDSKDSDMLLDALFTVLSLIPHKLLIPGKKNLGANLKLDRDDIEEEMWGHVLFYMLFW